MKAKTPELITFFSLLIGFSVLFNSLIVINGGGLSQNIPSALGLMFSPAVSALVARYAHNKTFSGFGWSWGSLRYQAIGYATPFFYIGLSYSLLYAIGIIEFKPDAFEEFGWVSLLQFFIVNILIGCLIVSGEEIGWRGYLLPNLCHRMSFTNASMWVGVIWVVAHYPILLLADYNTNGTPMWYSLICFTILALGANMAMNWLRMRSGSLWVVIIFHAAHNSILQDIHPLMINTEFSKYFVSEFGITLAVAGVLVGYVFWRKRDLLAKPSS